MKKTSWKIFLPGIGVLLFVWLLSRQDLGGVVAAVTRVPRTTIGLAAIIILVFIALKSVRHYVILLAQGVVIPFRLSTVLYYRSVFWGLVTPGRLGEFSRAHTLHKQDVPSRKSIGNVVIDRALDAISLACLSLLSLGFMTTDLDWIYVPGGLFILFITIGLAALYSTRLERFTPTFLQGPTRTLREALHIRNWPLILLGNMMLWGFAYVALHLLAQGIGIEQSFMFVVFCVSTSNLISAIPISIAGVGSRDLFLIQVFAGYGIGSETAIAFSFFFLAVYMMQIATTYPFLLIQPEGSNA